jgi:hypothetical protein
VSRASGLAGTIEGAVAVKRFLLALLTVVIGVVVVGGSVWLMSASQAEPATLVATVDGTEQTAQGTLPHATVELSIYPQAGSVAGPTTGVNAVISDIDQDGWPFYWPSTTLQLPAHSVITMTVHQYDSATTVYNDFFAAVHGTIGGTATYNGNVKSAIAPADVAHTFTIHQYPQGGQPNLFVSVPMLAVAADAKNEANGYPAPVDITFSFITGDPGEYVWNCEDPCGQSYQEFGGVMSARGWMSGTVTVV